MYRHHAPVIIPLPAASIDPLPLLDKEFDADALDTLDTHDPHNAHAIPTEISWEEIEDLAA